MRRLVLAAALALVPSLASAQAPAASRTFAGCDMYACLTFTVGYTTSLSQGQTLYRVDGNGALTLLAPSVTGAYGYVPLPTFSGGLFGSRDLEDLRYLPAPLSLVGHAAGDAIPVSLSSIFNTSFSQPNLDLNSFTGTFVSPTFGVTGQGFAITLSAVPEPGTLALAAAGLALIGGVVRRRRATTA